MFEKFYNYSDIKGKYIEILYAGCVPYFHNKIRGYCIKNPKYIASDYFIGSISECISIQVDQIPTIVSTSYHIMFNSKENRAHVIYIPLRSIQSIYLIKPDLNSKLMLLWISKFKKIPTDLIRFISEFMNKWELKIEVKNWC